MKTSKPYFSKEVEDKIVVVVFSELRKEHKDCDEQAVRAHIQRGKNTYENAILAGVAEGVYLATVVDDEMAYKINSPNQEEIISLYKASLEVHNKMKAKQDNILAAGGKPENLKPLSDPPTPSHMERIIKQARSEKLNHAINMIALYGGHKKLTSKAYDITSSTSSKPADELVPA